MSVDLPLIIVNPKSGAGTSQQKWASQAGIIRANLGPFDCEFTKARGDAIRIAEEEAKKGRKLIVAVGGDGTISEVANGILRSGSAAEMGVLPGGTGADFRRTLKIPSRLEEASRRLLSGSVRKLDAGRLTYIDHDGKEQTRYFINTASFGMSGRVAGRANQSSRRFGGTILYAIATLRTIVSYDHPEVFLQWDDQPVMRLKIITVCVANGPSFGGGMRIAPDAKPDDGIFDIVIVGDMKTHQVLLHSHRLYTGTFLSMEKVTCIRAKKLHAKPVDERVKVLLEADGETPGRLPATIEILPSAVPIRM